jgi:tetratricopeptide (TPR) repeat protein
MEEDYGATPAAPLQRGSATASPTAISTPRLFVVPATPSPYAIDRFLQQSGLPPNLSRPATNVVFKVLSIILAIIDVMIGYISKKFPNAADILEALLEYTTFTAKLVKFMSPYMMWLVQTFIAIVLLIGGSFICGIIILSKGRDAAENSHAGEVQSSAMKSLNLSIQNSPFYSRKEAVHFTAAGVDEVKLEEGTACQCSVDRCREEHHELHSEECRKRKAELHDKKLFTQPNETHLGECPLCLLPMPLDPQKTTIYPCCSKIVCDGCEYAHYKSGGSDRCPFCRESLADDEEKKKRAMKRVKANDPVAICQVGARHIDKGDYDSAFEYLTKAAELGDAAAHYQLGHMYDRGEGVEKDEAKGIYHYEKAAIGGHHYARYNLAVTEEENGNMKRAVKHLIIAANLGDEDSMKGLWKHYSAGNITKEDLEATLRTHQATIDAMKSEQREAAVAWRQRQRGA